MDFFSVLAWIGVFLSPVKELIFVLLFFIIIDFFTGAWNSVRKGEKFHSKKIGNTVSKIILYTLGVIVAHVAQKYIFPDQIPFISIITGFICMTEIKSIYENISEITGIDIWKQVMYYINSKKNLGKAPHEKKD